MSMFGAGNWSLCETEEVIVCRANLLADSHLLVGLTRVRDESLILQDSLDYVGSFVDAIVAYDDASTDDTFEILKSHPKVALVIKNNVWKTGTQARLESETRHRGLLLQIARKYLRCEWIYCFDADERIIGGVRDFISNVREGECNGVRIQLFDAYLTPDDHAPYSPGTSLLGLRRNFGPERRDILMLWRNLPHVRFCGLDSREPLGVERMVTAFYCQHYGKAISVSQWDATCDYYAANFPKDTYGLKWLSRKGKAIHTYSDFGRQLYEWGQFLFANSIKLTEVPKDDEGKSSSKNIDTKRFSILFATDHLFYWAGSETLLLTLVGGLLKDCEIIVYARYLDKKWIGRHIDRSVRLIDSLEAVRENKFDLAHVQHCSCVVDIRAVFPNLPILFSSLGVLPFLEQPVPFDVGVSHYLAISEEVTKNLVGQGVPESAITIIRNLVSSQRFFPKSPIRQRPERILVLSNKIDEGRSIILRAAARIIGASIKFVGVASATIPQDKLCDAINGADVVVTLGRGVVETMLCGRVPLVFDIHGGDGLVTPENFHVLKTCNFSGRYRKREYSIGDLVREFQDYRQEYGACLREMAITEFGIEVNLSRFFDLYETVAATPVENFSISQKKILQFCSALAHEDAMQAKRHYETVLAQSLEISRLKNTVSWKLTSPLRVISNLVRKLF